MLAERELYLNYVCNFGNFIQRQLTYFLVHSLFGYSGDLICSCFIFLSSDKYHALARVYFIGTAGEGNYLNSLEELI